jgi:hypothetical protein
MQLQIKIIEAGFARGKISYRKRASSAKCNLTAPEYLKIYGIWRL